MASGLSAAIVGVGMLDVVLFPAEQRTSPTTACSRANPVEENDNDARLANS